MKARVLKTEHLQNINTRFIKVEKAHGNKHNMLHLLENMAAVLL